MTRPRLEVAEVIRSCRDAFLQKYGACLTSEQRRALDDLTACRTAALGGHVLECPGCGHQEVAVYFPTACRASVVTFRREGWAVRWVGGVRRVPAGRWTGLSPTSGLLRTGDCPV